MDGLFFLLLHPKITQKDISSEDSVDENKDAN